MLSSSSLALLVIVSSGEIRKSEPIELLFKP